MKAVSFMYVRPLGYNAESAKAAEIAEETRKQEESDSQLGPEGTSYAVPLEGLNKDQLKDGKKKTRPRDVFGRALPTEVQFEVLKNAPKRVGGELSLLDMKIEEAVNR